MQTCGSIMLLFIIINNTMEITHNGKTYQATGYIRRNLEDYINLKVEDIQEIKTEVPIRSYPIEKIVKKEEECKDH
jgi:hypothetical protein